MKEYDKTKKILSEWITEHEFAAITKLSYFTNQLKEWHVVRLQIYSHYYSDMQRNYVYFFVTDL